MKDRKRKNERKMTKNFKRLQMADMKQRKEKNDFTHAL